MIKELAKRVGLNRIKPLYYVYHKYLCDDPHPLSMPSKPTVMDTDGQRFWVSGSAESYIGRSAFFHGVWEPDATAVDPQNTTIKSPSEPCSSRGGTASRRPRTQWRFPSLAHLAPSDIQAAGSWSRAAAHGEGCDRPTGAEPVRQDLTTSTGGLDLRVERAHHGR